MRTCKRLFLTLARNAANPAPYFRLPDELDHFLDARTRDALGLREREKMTACGPSGVNRFGVEERSHLVKWRSVLGVALAVDGR